MALRTAAQYRESLRDGRVVFYRGQRVPDVTEHPVIRVAIEHASIDYEMAERPETRDLAVVKSPETGEPISRYFQVPRSAEDLLKRSALIEAATREGGTLVVLIKEIGSDALFALQVVADQMDKALGTHYGERVARFYRHCRDQDLAMAVAQTDVKGDRSLGPAAQAHPDYYLRIVEERPDGIVIRGAKAHTSVSPNANEIIVLPTRALTEQDAAYAVAFAVPANARGLKLLASPYGAPRPRPFESPITAAHKMMETLTVFEDVLVPHERVFLKGEWKYAGLLALTFVEFHRFTAISYKLPLVDLLVGAARLIAEYNGLEKVGHIRDKLIHLIAYAETLRALIRQAALECRTVPPGLAVPSPLLVNIAKHHFASGYAQAVAWVQEIAGGLLVTGPGQEDWESPETRPYLERYLGGARGVPAEHRLRLMNLIQDLTASDFGGYQAVLAIHAEGSIEAEKLAAFRAYDPKPAVAYAKRLASIPEA